MPQLNEGSNYRRERIERLLKELRYEIEIGMMQGEINESLGMRWIVPVSKAIPDGVVMCELRTRPVPRFHAFGIDGPEEPRLRAVK